MFFMKVQMVKLLLKMDSDHKIINAFFFVIQLKSVIIRPSVPDEQKDGRQVETE